GPRGHDRRRDGFFSHAGLVGTRGGTHAMMKAMDAVWAGVAIGLTILVTVRYVRARRSRDHAAGLLAMYRNPGYPIAIRNGIAVGPILLIGVATAVLPGILLGRTAAQWMTVPALLIAQTGYVLAYRVPAPFLPQWLLEDLATGRLDVARPDSGD